MTFSTDFFTHHGQLSLLSLTIRPEKVSGVKVEVTGSHTLNINFYSCKKRLFTFLAAHGHNFGSISLKFMHMLNILSNTLQNNPEKIFIFVETPGLLLSIFGRRMYLYIYQSIWSLIMTRYSAKRQ